jgi:hypothetical protein
MARVSFSKLNAKIDTSVEKVNFNEVEIEVKQYLPITEKMEVINAIVNGCMSRNDRYYNPGEVEADMILQIVMNYSNISFTDKQIADTAKLYDTIMSSGLAKKIIWAIPDEEINMFRELLTTSLENVYKQRNSVMGILETISTDYSNLKYDAQEIRDDLVADKDIVQNVRDIVTNLG